MSGGDDSGSISPRDWVIRYIARLLGLESHNVDLNKGLAEYNLDSVDGVIMAGEFEKYFDVEIDPATFFEFTTFQQMIDNWGVQPR